MKNEILQKCDGLKKPKNQGKNKEPSFIVN